MRRMVWRSETRRHQAVNMPRISVAARDHHQHQRDRRHGVMARRRNISIRRRSGISIKQYKAHQNRQMYQRGIMAHQHYHEMAACINMASKSWQRSIVLKA